MISDRAWRAILVLLFTLCKHESVVDAASPYESVDVASRASSTGVVVHLSDWADVTSMPTPIDEFIQPVLFQAPAVLPETPISSSLQPGSQREVPVGRTTSTLGSTLIRPSLGEPLFIKASLPPTLRARVLGPSIDVVQRGESKVLPVTFADDLITKSMSVKGVYSSKRSPVVSDTRIRGKRAGQTLASGSFWVPARMDLDTMLSKIDADLVEDLLVIKGPYSVLHGPGLDFIDLHTIHSPRYSNGPETHGSTSIDFETNNGHWYGRQTLWGGAEDWGFYVGYGHRTANDYTSGNGTAIPSSFKARDLYLALGYDLDADQHIELNVIRLDETDVEFPGQAFDIDFLATDGFEIEYTSDDFVSIEAWYNRTRFAGSSQRESKRRQFPVFDAFSFIGNTDVDSMSSGYRYAMTWQPSTSSQLVTGTDLRYVKQELNEITSGTINLQAFWRDTNSPIPRSHSSNPGLFAEWTWEACDYVELRSGARVDWVSTNLDADANEIAALGAFRPGFQPALHEIIGSDDYDRDFTLWSAYLSGEVELSPYWNLLGSGGHGQRVPSMTELYAAESFMFLLQNGLNTVTGDPRLKPERAWQIDLGLQYHDPDIRISANGFHAWIFDYITYENITDANRNIDTEQVNLKFVNTDLATLSGFELAGECDLTGCLSCFGTLSYVEGRDHSRNGDFYTQPVGSTGVPSVQLPGSRGQLSNVSSADEEPLPSILPLESRLGLRLHPPGEHPDWSVEFSARIVDNQDRVAGSLREQVTPGFTVFDARSFWQVNDTYLLVAGVQNLGDLNYREHLDFRPLPGGRSLPLFRMGTNLYFGAELQY